MASLGHVAVAMAAGRAWAGKSPSKWRVRSAWVVFSLLAMSPDADVIAFALGIPYDAPWGHRGATHSIVFGFLLAGAAAAVAKLLKLPPLRTFVAAAACTVSHGLLDALTNGGLGSALLWPFSDERFFAPITPIPVAPIGLYMFSEKGLLVLLVELFMFCPFLIYATFPRKAARAPTGV